ncbi:MAG: class I SAM-dependent methyltransferase [Anaerolineae bacterium]
MSTIDTTMTAANAAQHAAERDAFVERVLQSVGGVFDMFTMYIGDRLGLYTALAENGPMTSVELAERTDTQERYVREWLEQQTVTGVLEVINPDAGPTARWYRLPPAHAEVLVERDSLNYLAPMAQLAVGVTRPVTAVVEAFRHGGGVPFGVYGADVREGQAGVNRAAFLTELGETWLPSLPDVHARLLADPPARVADIGVGAGWSSIGIALRYPKVQVDGFDLDAPSIALARANAQTVGLNGRVNFHVRDAGDSAIDGAYDLVTAFEAVHDMSDPVAAMRTMRRLACEDGAVIVVDERVGDSFTPSGNDVEWMMYGWSVLHCLPVGMADQSSVGTGTVMRTDTLRRYAQEAGFRDVEVLPIDNYFFRFYRLVQ